MHFGEHCGEWARRVRMLFSSRWRFDREMEEEMALHRDLRAEELQQSGVGREEAHYAAHRRLGNSLRLREEIHEAWSWAWIDDLIQDLHYGLRLLRKAPGFGFVVIVTLALGIGANTAIFSVVDAILLRPLPYFHSQQLVSVLEDNKKEGITPTGAPYTDFEEIRDSGMFAQVGGADRHDLTLTGAGDPTTVSTVSVTPEMFPILGISPTIGRYVEPADNQKGAVPVVVLSEGLWRTRFGGDPHILGRSIRLDQQAFTVVGVMPAVFQVPIFPPDQQIWIPLIQDPLFGPWMQIPDRHLLPMIARLKPGSSLANAQAEAVAMSHTVVQKNPKDGLGWAVSVQPLHEILTGNVRTPLLLLLGAVGLLLLLACVNIANLLLARATARAREMALRQAVGAGRGRIVRQLLTESVLLGAIGAILGILLAYSSTSALASMLPSDLPAMQPIEVNGWVLGFALLLSLLASVGFGLAPALIMARSSVHNNLKDGAAGSGSDAGRLRLRNLLTGAEIALATVLVISAGLLARSLSRVTSVDPGFQPEHLVKAQVSLPRYQYSSKQQWSEFGDELLARVQVQPGLQDSALGIPLPIADQQVAGIPFSILGQPDQSSGKPDAADYVSVSPNYFRVMSIPLLHGRVFSSHDSFTSPPVAMISASLARTYFRDQNPIGQKLIFGAPLDTNRAREVVGVIADIHNRSLTDEPGPMMYVPFAQAPLWGSNVVVRSTLPTSAVVSGLRAAVKTIDKNLPITDVATIPDAMDSSVAATRFRSWLLSAFGGVALLLAAAGVLGVVSYSVARRTKEFGVRASLGATPSTIGRMVVNEGLFLTASGLAVGLIASFALTRLLKSQLYGVTTYDPITFGGSIVILLLVALVACYLPARRAMRVDPIIALRCE